MNHHPLTPLAARFFRFTDRISAAFLKRSVGLLLALLCGAQLAHAAAPLPTYDGINYDPGYDLGSNTDTNGNTSQFAWTHIGIVGGRSGSNMVASGGLSYPGL